jgi:hypothetical protein
MYPELLDYFHFRFHHLAPSPVKRHTLFHSLFFSLAIENASTVQRGRKGNSCGPPWENP